MTKAASRRAGRPDAQMTAILHRHILDTATRLFIENGYTATSMEQVASAARAGKQTIYRRYASKEELFTAVTRELAAVVIENAVTTESASDPLSALRDTCWATLELAARPEAADLHRILVSEALRFPELVQRSLESVSGPMIEAIKRLVLRARDCGQIRSDIPIDNLLFALNGITVGWYIQQRSVGYGFLSTETERRDFFDVAWNIFVKGVSP